LVLVEGKIQSRSYQDRAGQPRTSFEIVASNFRILGGKAKEEENTSEPKAQFVPSDEDVPF
jgi:single-stranded DNA-binding protein